MRIGNCHKWDGMGWIGYLRVGWSIEHLTVLIICHKLCFVCHTIDALPLTSVSRSCSLVKIRVSASNAYCWMFILASNKPQSTLQPFLLISQQVFVNICRRLNANSTNNAMSSSCNLRNFHKVGGVTLHWAKAIGHFFLPIGMNYNESTMWLGKFSIHNKKAKPQCFVTTTFIAFAVWGKFINSLFPSSTHHR